MFLLRNIENIKQSNLSNPTFSTECWYRYIAYAIRCLHSTALPYPDFLIDVPIWWKNPSKVKGLLSQSISIYFYIISYSWVWKVVQSYIHVYTNNWFKDISITSLLTISLKSSEIFLLKIFSNTCSIYSCQRQNVPKFAALICPVPLHFEIVPESCFLQDIPLKNSEVARLKCRSYNFW